MPRLIDADALIESIKAQAGMLKWMLPEADEITDVLSKGFIEQVNKMPTIQPERKKGKWTEKEMFCESEVSAPITEWQSARCSKCGKYHTTPYLYYFDNFNFCPNCGADMGERREDAEIH